MRALPRLVPLALVVCALAAPSPAYAVSGSGLAWSYFPGPVPLNSGGTATTRDFGTPGWLNSTTTLSGPDAVAYLDVNDNDSASPGELVGPSSASSWNYPFTSFSGPLGSSCSTNLPCGWDSSSPTSWQVNANQSATQAFWFVNTFHDHLAAAPIDFTAGKGSFEDSDPVLVEVMDGAAVSSDGGPDAEHLNVVSMTTPPDGESPRLELPLFSDYRAGGVDSVSADDASLVYHAYAAGMADRLVVDAQGRSALTGAQGRAMREGWGDWYAMDYLVERGFDADTVTVGDVKPGFYVSGGAGTGTQPLDCPVATTTSPCTNGNGAGAGGYTYADYGRVAGTPDAAGDGEIWAQTLWELRQVLVANHGATDGVARARTYVTRALELAPDNPSMVDLRNAMLQAAAGSGDTGDLWSVFARRGLGYFAAAVDGNDTAPVASFAEPPALTGTVSGRVTLVDGGTPAAGITVSPAGHPELTTTSGADGGYTLTGVPLGTYPALITSGAGHVPTRSGPVTVDASTTKDLLARRNWAQADGGGAVAGFTGPDRSAAGCGPAGAIDAGGNSGWGSAAAQSVTIRLPRAVDLTGLAIDPAAVCGDAETAGLAGYRIETSPDGSAYTEAAAGTFTAADDHRLNPLVPAAAARSRVGFVRVTVLSSRSGATPDPDLSEIAVYGVPSAAVVQPPPPPPAAPAVTPVTLPNLAKKLQVSRKGTVKVQVAGPATSAGTLAVKAKGVGTVRAAFTTSTGGTATVKLKLSTKQLTKLRAKGRAKATVTLTLAGVVVTAKVKLSG